MVKGLFAWLLDPEHPGRKRGVAVVLFLLAELLRAADSAIAKACAAALIAGPVCSVHPADYAPWIDAAYQGVQRFVVPGADALATIVGIWGLFHALKRQHVVTPL